MKSLSLSESFANLNCIKVFAEMKEIIPKTILDPIKIIIILPFSPLLNHQDHHHPHHHETDHVCPWIRAAANVFSQTLPFVAGRSHPIPSSPDRHHHRDDGKDDDDNDYDDGQKLFYDH